jgi:hypothetical protein
MLLGREAMNGRVLIDPEGLCLQGDKQEENLVELYKIPAKKTTKKK